MEYTRRDAIKLGLFGSAALAIPLERAARADSALDNRMPTHRLPAPFTLPFAVPPIAVPHSTDGDTDRYRIGMDVVQLEVLPGFQTTWWGYGGTVPGPTIVMEHGRKSKVRFVNNLPLKHPTLGYTPWTSVHLHGSPSLPQYDGYANDITYPGQYKDYHYPNSHEATTHWYHDHGVHHTTENILMGLAGMYQIHDDRDRSLPIPHGDYDVPVIFGDRMFDKNGQLLFVERPVRHVRRRDPRQRRAVAADEGAAPQVPVPAAERLDLARLQPVALERRPVHRDLHRRRPDAGAADRSGACGT